MLNEKRALGNYCLKSQFIFRHCYLVFVNMWSDFVLQTDNNGTNMFLSGLWKRVGWWMNSFVTEQRWSYYQSTWCNTNNMDDGDDNGDDDDDDNNNNNNNNNTIHTCTFLRSSKLIYCLVLMRLMQIFCEKWLLALTCPSVRPHRLIRLPP